MRRAADARIPAAASRPVQNDGYSTRYHTFDQDIAPLPPELRERAEWWRCGRNRNAALRFILAMANPILTLTTDFGLSDHYTGVMKGVILGICPKAQIVDISHEITPHEISEGGYVIAQAWRYFPKKTVHVVVVDPGVGTARRPLLMEA